MEVDATGGNVHSSVMGINSGISGSGGNVNSSLGGNTCFGGSGGFVSRSLCMYCLHLFCCANLRNK